MIFEDAHWTDPTSLEVLGRAVDRIKTLPVLLIVTFRLRAPERADARRDRRSGVTGGGLRRGRPRPRRDGGAPTRPAALGTRAGRSAVRCVRRARARRGLARVPGGAL